MHASPTVRYRDFEPDDVAVLAPWLAAAGLGLPGQVDTQAWGDRLRSDPLIVCQAACDPDGHPVGFARLDVGPDVVE